MSASAAVSSARANNVGRSGGDAAVGRGRIDVSASAVAGGAQVTVTSQHKDVGDKLTFSVHAQVNGRYIELKTLASDQVANASGYRGTTTLTIDYGDLTNLLRQKAGQNASLSVAQGTQLAINAKWQNGHQWGLPSSGKSGGEFSAP